ncbi:MAG: M1 family metallopeptidase [Acidobacteriota bacterium]
MKSRSLALLLLLALLPGAANAVAPLRLGDDVVPKAQALRLRLDPAAAVYSGDTTIDLDVRRAVDQLRFHAAGETLGTLALHDPAGAAVETKVEHDGDVVTVRPTTSLKPGAYRLDIAFTQRYNTQAVSLYRVAVGADSYLFTQFEQIDARGAFPCFDEPGFKIPWSVVLEVPENDLAISNMSVQKEEKSGGRKTVTFKPTPPLPSYLVAVAVGPFESIPIPGLSVPGRIVTVRGEIARASLAAEVTPPALAALEAYFGRPYPFDKVDLIAVPDFAYGAMENAGAITFADRILLVDPREKSEQAKSRLLFVTAHELAHMWFGDLVTMRWWNDLWLNESFADWMANKVAIQVAPQMHFEIDDLQATDRAMRNDGSPKTKALRLPDDCAVAEAFENVGQAYAKGRGVLGMVEGWIGADAFRGGMLAYLNEHAWGNADANDLWRSLGKVAQKDVVGVLSGFAQQPGVPLLDMTVEAGRGGTVSFSQERFHRSKGTVAEMSWHVPVTLAFADDQGMHRASVVLEQRQAKIALHAHGTLHWVLPNAGGRGYYRWRLANGDLDRLLAARAELTAGERVAALGNLRALLDAGRLEGGQWVRTLSSFADDTDPLVATPVIEAVAALETPFAVGSTAAPYAEFIRCRFGPAASRAGWSPTSGQSLAAEDWRGQLLSLVGNEGEDHAVRSEARRLAERWLAGEASIVAPNLVGTMLQLAALDGDGALFDAYQARLAKPASPTERRALLGGIGSFSDPALSAKALESSLGDGLRSSETVAILFAVDRTEEGRDRGWKWLQANWAALVAKVPPPVVPGLPRLAAGCSKERMESAQAFFSGKENPGLADGLGRAVDSTSACLELRNAQGKSVEDALRADAAH